MCTWNCSTEALNNNETWTVEFIVLFPATFPVKFPVLVPTDVQIIILKKWCNTAIEVSSNNSRDAPNNKIEVWAIFDTTSDPSDTFSFDCKTRQIKFEIKNYKHDIKKHVIV